MDTQHPLRCRCGTLRGHIALPAATARAVCYCVDCQAYAHFLKRADDVLNDAAGTDIVAMLPKQVHFEQGLDALRCMSLSEHGLLRWYAGCCNTPIGNTPRDRKIPYIGLVHSCLSAQALEASFGPVQVNLNMQSAHAPVRSTGWASLLAMGKLMRAMLPARLRGGWRDNPFFEPQRGTPIRVPHALGTAERMQLGLSPAH